MKKRVKSGRALALAVALAVSGTFMTSVIGEAAEGPKEASSYTIQANNEVYNKLDFNDEQEREFASRGLIAAPEKLEIKNDQGKVVWSQVAYAFLDKKAPDTANPSLWRNAQLNHYYGLFKVTDDIYQVRGYDMSNITFVKGNTGWIIFDPLMSVECSKAAKQLVDEQLGVFPVKAIIYSHSHIDHYGGVRGILDMENPEQFIKDNGISIIAPEGFEENVVSENVYAGPAMARRAAYQYGVLLEPGEKGRLSIGIGMGQSTGHTSYISPTDIITTTGEKRIIDGVTMEFQMTPGTEAPSEMNTWFPDKKALWVAENCTGTLHNLYTLRGAQVRDGNKWAYYIMEAQSRYGKDAEVTFQAHNWPHWGNKVIKEYMTNTALAYKYINDQTLFYMNQGLTQNEVAYKIKLPDALQKVWYTRQYYGTVAHNSKAVYEKFMGWYDANPVNLNKLPPVDTAKKTVEYMGGSKAILEKAKKDYEAGKYQWVAEVTNQIVFAEPKNQEARNLCADAMDQLAYQAESGTWRNAYLCAAKELRNGSVPFINSGGGEDVRKKMGSELMLDYIGISLNSDEAQDLNFTANLNLTDTGEKYLLTVKSGILVYQKGVESPEADATWTMPKEGLFTILSKNKEMQQKFHQDGNKELLGKLTDKVVIFTPFFPIIEP